MIAISTAIGDVDRRESRVIRNPSLVNDQLRHCRWRDSYGHMGSGMVPVIVNWLNWKVTYQILLMPRFIAFEFSYDFLAIDFDWLGCWRVSLLIGLWNQLGIVSAMINLNWVYIWSLIASQSVAVNPRQLLLCRYHDASLADRLLKSTQNRLCYH